jgi:hypothetical protein
MRTRTRTCFAGVQCTVVLPRTGRYREALLDGCKVEKADVGSQFACIVLDLVDVAPLSRDLPCTNKRVSANQLASLALLIDCCQSTARASVQS